MSTQSEIKSESNMVSEIKLTLIDLQTKDDDMSHFIYLTAKSDNEGNYLRDFIGGTARLSYGFTYPDDAVYNIEEAYWDGERYALRLASSSQKIEIYPKYERVSQSSSGRMPSKNWEEESLERNQKLQVIFNENTYDSKEYLVSKF